MNNVSLPSGTVHDKVPVDFQKALISSAKALSLWQSITPLARNEWICWVENAKKDETRQRRIQVGISKLNSGMRRPCCWIGCIHRPDKPVSPSVQWALNKQSKTN